MAANAAISSDTNPVVIPPKICIGLLASAASPKYVAQINNCKKTWIPEASKADIPVLFLCGDLRNSTCRHDILDKSSEDESQVVFFENVADDYLSASSKQYYGLRYMYARWPDYDFFFIGGTDNYVEVNNLLRELSTLSPNAYLYIGGHDGQQYVGYTLSFHFGGGGIIFSRGALQRLDIKNKADDYLAEWDKMTKSSTVLRPACDVSIAYFSERVGLQFVTLQNMYACDWRGKLEGMHCCTLNYPKLITCHFMEENMLLYHSIKNELMTEWYRSRLTMLYTAVQSYPDTILPYADLLKKLASKCNYIVQLRNTKSLSCIPFIKGLVDNKNGHAKTLRSYESMLTSTTCPIITLPSVEGGRGGSCTCYPLKEIPEVARGLGLDYRSAISPNKADDTVASDIAKADLLYIESQSFNNEVEVWRTIYQTVKKYIVVYNACIFNEASIPSSFEIDPLLSSRNIIILKKIISK